MTQKLALHWQILIGMIAGIIFGYLLSHCNWGSSFISDWIKPIGKIFINLLKLIAIPLIIVSLIKGIADLKDISKFSKIGGKTIVLYIASTIIAISVGLIFVNLFNPGDSISQSTLLELTNSYQEITSQKVEVALSQKNKGPFDFIVSIVPQNFLEAAASNSNMLQVIFFVIFFGIGLLLIDPEKAKSVTSLIDGLNDIVLKMVDLIMLIAPYAVFSLLASLVVETTNTDLLIALGKYSFTVMLGLFTMVVFYIIVVSTYTKKSPNFFMRGISPAQLLAFSTSSSAATLPVTMERVEEHLGVGKEVASFVCPVGATINMDGTSLYQAVAAVFICQALDFDLTFSDQLTIILTATLASIGSAAVPGAGMVMLVVVLEAIGLPADKLAIGLSMIFAVDRPLDMMRTTINVTGDATVSMIVAKSVGKLGEPKTKYWDDHIENH